MKKIFSLIKASMSEGMNLFKINTKNKNKIIKILVPVALAIILMSVMYSYAEMIIKELENVNMQFVVLTLFIIFTTITTLIEGIYKSGNLLFNCKDDNLLLSLPIKRKTVLFIRVFKFYVFEFIYNSILLLPSIIAYAVHVKPGILYYIVSFIGLILFPIIPILISCIIGTFITYFSSNFKGKNIVQTVITFILLLAIIYVSYNLENLVKNISQNASNLNDFITKIYYPAGAFISLIDNFRILEFLKFIFIHLLLFVITIALIGKIYFNVNSNAKSVRTKKINKKYTIKTSTPTIAIIKKELGRFINSPVFVTNAAFGLIIFIIGCILISTKIQSVSEILIDKGLTLTIDYIKNCMPIILLGFICLSSFTTSITSSMISLEGKSFNILKSLPIKPYKIIRAKVLTSILIMIPCIIIGDIIIFVQFKFNLFNILMILLASILLPLIAETIGIIVNLKYPRMDAKNDTEVVKQSMSSTISVFIGFAIIGLNTFLLYKALSANISINFIMLASIGVYAMIYMGLLIYLQKTCEKSFNDILI